jgi:predicted nucleotide-binding protein with TIR-like domain
MLIPTPVIAVIAKALENYLSHTEISTLMESLDVPGLPPSGNKVDKIKGWLRNINADSDPRNNPLEKLGKVLEEYMEVDHGFEPNPYQVEGRKKIQEKLKEYDLGYSRGSVFPMMVLPKNQPSWPMDIATTEELSAFAEPVHQSLFRPESAPKPEPQKQKHTIFIGHGRSLVWRELKDFIVDRLRQDYEEFNREATAGISTKERLEAMLKKADFAFLVMTAEDERRDGKLYARDNVIHEAGLFQGRLGSSVQLSC